jgi:DUF1365 family protein
VLGESVVAWCPVNEPDSSVATSRFFQAHFDTKREPLTAYGLASCMLRFPFITWAVQFWIHLQAFKLWMKKVKPTISACVVNPHVARLR